MTAPQSSTPTGVEQASSTGKRFIDMTMSDKVTFVGKVFVMLITGGFAFPNIFVE